MIRKNSNPASVLEKSRNDPAWWVKNVLGDKPWPIQAKILKSLVHNRETNVKSSHSVGKSWVAARASLWFLFNYPGSLVITTAPTDRQVRGILWKEIRTAFKNAKLPLGGKVLTQQLNIRDDWLAMGFTANDYDPDKFQGFHSQHVLVVVDEACGITDAIDQGIESILSSEHSRLLRIGNPTNENTPFGRSFKAAEGSKFTISAFDTPNMTSFGITPNDIVSGAWKEKVVSSLPYPTLVTPQWVDHQYKKWGLNSPIWQARVMGEFPSNQDNTLIPLSWIEAAQRRVIEPSVNDKITFGIDVSRFGANETIVMKKHGNHARIVGSWGAADTMQTSGKIIHLSNQWNPVNIFVDSVGVGGGVVDRLRESHIKYGVYDVNAGSSAKDKTRFLNMRAELFWNLREKFEKGEIDIDPHDEDLVAQLCEINFSVASNGKIKIESKDDMRKRGINSPDRADALALAFKGSKMFSYDFELSDAGRQENPWKI